jgi:hypothetical protein
MSRRGSGDIVVIPTTHATPGLRRSRRLANKPLHSTVCASKKREVFVIYKMGSARRMDKNWYRGNLVLSLRLCSHVLSMLNTSLHFETSSQRPRPYPIRTCWQRSKLDDKKHMMILRMACRELF